MARHLVTLSLGPVQSLIGAARRTRDLWCGSWLLSEAARAAARVLHKRHPGCLIFPCPELPDDELRPQNLPGDAANIANVLRAEVDLADDAAARALCADAQAAAAARLVQLGAGARERLGHPVRDDVWRAQIDDILEGFAAWAPVSSDDGGYGEANRRLGAVLSARKATRDFGASRPLAGEKLPKSSLDGALETVLPKWPENHPARRKLRLSTGEQLDALGVNKRLAGDAEQFTAWPRIAADTWIEALTPDQQRRLREACDPLVRLELSTRVRGNAGIYEPLPFDGHLLYAFRLENELVRARCDRDGSSPEIEALERLRKCIRDIAKEKNADGAPVGVPVPYAAVLKADGDRMGQLLWRAESAQRSRDISRALHSFASTVRGIVRKYRGHAIYAGGDDVLALAPLAQAFRCARALQAAFAESLGPVAADMRVLDERPTLSVGIGIGHVIEPLGALRARADRAEHDAKGDTEAPEAQRNALAVRLGIRSGAERRWRAQWTDKSAIEALDRFTDAYDKSALPTRAAYDLRNIDRRLAWLRDDDSDTARRMRTAEVERLLDRARSDGGSRAIPEELRALVRRRAKCSSLAAVADALIIARWLSARTAGDLGVRS